MPIPTVATLPVPSQASTLSQYITMKLSSALSLFAVLGGVSAFAPTPAGRVSLDVMDGARDGFDSGNREPYLIPKWELN